MDDHKLPADSLVSVHRCDEEIARILAEINTPLSLGEMQGALLGLTDWSNEKRFLMGTIRTFDTGATRDTDTGKLDYEGFLSPLVLKRFAEYMNKNRVQSDGSLRDSDNWQKGIPRDQYMKSMWRHFMDVWTLHRGGSASVDIDEALCAVLFNAMGYLHEHLKCADAHSSSSRP